MAIPTDTIEKLRQVLDFTPKRRHALAARCRAELLLRAAALRGLPIEWSGRAYFYEGWPILRAEGPMLLGTQPRIRGGPVRTRLHTWPTGRLEFGAEVGINFGAEISAALSVKIGDYSALGPYVTVYDTNFHEVSEGEKPKTAPVEIGRNVWIGRAAIILPGVTIGDHSVVASGALVAGDVPPRTLVAGNPAKIVRAVEATDDWRRM